MGSGRSSGARHPRQVAALIESHFGESMSLSVGIEEELMILDAETLLPAGAVDVLVRESGDLDLPGRLKTELHASVVELNTGICADVGSAVDALRALRVAAAEIAAANGLAIAGAGAHPTATYDSLLVVQEERYLAMMRDVGFAARRQGVNGLHVHVGIESADACYERLEAVLPWLPMDCAASSWLRISRSLPTWPDVGDELATTSRKPCG